MSIGADQLPPLTWLRAFEASARHLSFTRAAGELGLTQSAISQHVRNLEAYLGRDLFIRKTRVLELTEDGSNYLPGIREAFGLIANSTEAFRSAHSKTTFRLQCNLAFSVFWLAPRLHRLYARHPWLTLDIVSPIWDPERHATHAAIEIRFGRPDEMSKTAERIADEQFFPVCTPDYLSSGAPLDSAPLFDCAGTTGTWQAWSKSAGLGLGPRPQINLCSTYVTALNAALHGAGMSMAHNTLVDSYLRDGTLMRPYDHAPAMSEGYYLFPPSPHLMNRAAEAFLAWFQDELAQPRDCITALSPPD